MTINELKEYIYNQNKIEYILQQIGCHEIKYNNQKEYWSASFPDGDNPMGVVVKNNKYLSCYSYSRQNDFSDNSDIITLIQYINKLQFIESVKLLHKILDIPFNLKRKAEKKENKYDPLSVFKKVLRNNNRVINVDDIHILDEELLNDYVPMLHISWFREGIMPWTRKKFDLAYSYKHSRIVIPHRYWLTGELLGFNMRTTVSNWDEFGIKKYYLTNGYNKSLNIYGLYENYDAIQKVGYVTIFEAEKSVLKRGSLLDSSGVAVSGHMLSDEQIRILIGLNVEIVIAFDKDISLEEIRYYCEKFKNIRKVSYIYDKWDILSKKDSPADASNKDYQFLFNNRVVYDETEHKKYLESLKR